MMKGIVALGMIVGGVAAWLYWDEIVDYLQENTRDARARAAESLRAAGQAVEEAQPRVEAAIRAGQEAVRSAF